MPGRSGGHPPPQPGGLQPPHAGQRGLLCDALCPSLENGRPQGTDKETTLKKMIGFGVAAAMLALAAAHYLGRHWYYEYKRERAAAQILERSFPELERNLKRAAALSKNPLLFKELGRLYLEM